MTWKISSLYVFIGIQLLVNFEPAEAADQLTLGAGKPGSVSHQLGVGLTSLIKIVILPSKGIDLSLVHQNNTQDDKDFLIATQDEIQTLRSDFGTDAFSSVMAFRSSDAVDELVLELLVRAHVSTDVVYDITRTIFENGPFLDAVNDRAWDLSVDQAMRDLQLPIHRGALRFYGESGGLDPLTAENSFYDVSTPKTDQDGADFYGESTFYVYFNKQQVQLDRAAQDQIAAACHYAAISQTPLIRISGQLSEPTRDAAERVTNERLNLVMTTLEQDAKCGPDASIVVVDDAEVTLPAELIDGNDDHVGITIMLPHRPPQ